MADEKQKTCPGNCAMCSVYQRNYCAATMSRNIQDMVATLSNEVSMLRKRLDTLMTNGEILMPPMSAEAPASEAQDGAVQTIGSTNVKQLHPLIHYGL